MGETANPILIENVNLTAQWRVHTPNLLSEIGKNQECSVLRQPLMILGNILAELGERALKLNDPELNALMCRLTIYSCADPQHPEYDPELTKKTMVEAYKPK